MLPSNLRFWNRMRASRTSSSPARTPRIMLNCISLHLCPWRHGELSRASPSMHQAGHLWQGSCESRRSTLSQPHRPCQVHLEEHGGIDQRSSTEKSHITPVRPRAAGWHHRTSNGDRRGRSDHREWGWHHHCAHRVHQSGSTIWARQLIVASEKMHKASETRNICGGNILRWNSSSFVNGNRPFGATSVVIMFQYQFQVFKMLYHQLWHQRFETSLCQGSVLTYMHPYVHHAGHPSDTSSVHDVWAYQGPWAQAWPSSISGKHRREPTASISDSV